MLSIDTIARGVVNVSVPLSFDTGLLLIKNAAYINSKRLKSYTSGSSAAVGSLESVVINVNVQL